MTKEIEVLVFDTETTGLPHWKIPSGDPSQPHLVQLATVVCDVENRKIKQSINVIVKPDGWTIPNEVTEIHGITTEYAMEVGLPEKDVIGMFINMLGSKTRIAHNTTFDNRIIHIGLKRFFDDKAVDKFKAGNYYCTMINLRKIIGGKNPKLVDAYKYFTGKKLENAHSAMADTLACMEVYWGIQSSAELKRQFNKR